MKVYTSNLSDLTGLKDIYSSEEGDVSPGTLEEVIEQINLQCPGLKNRVIRNGAVVSTAGIYFNITEKDGKIYDTAETVEVRDPGRYVSSDDIILISIFEPSAIEELIGSTIGAQSASMLRFNERESGRFRDKEYNRYVDPVIKSDVEEPIYGFIPGQCTLEELAVPRGEELILTPSPAGEDDPFDRKSCKLLPSELIDSLVELWGLDSKGARLRLFQEDALFFLSAKLNRSDLIPEECLLLSVPTGGGKTEAFLLPLIAHILMQKRRMLEYGSSADERVRAIIVYPTKALANDQARRLSQILEICNYDLPMEMQVSLGILTGDTPQFGGYKLTEDNLFKVCPNPRCGEAVPSYEKMQLPSGAELELQRCRSCGRSFPYLRLTRQDILDAPPDILITNPDMINYSMQSPVLRKVFEHGTDIMVFDEVHQCTGVFGCHVAHLLRRMEEIAGGRPVYVGISATIKNAKEVAALLFDVPLSGVYYLNPVVREYLDKSTVSHYRRHLSVRPAEWGKDRYRSTLSTSVRLLNLLGHAVRDPHFRKTLAFCNYRQDTDDLVKSLTIQEERYFIPYKENIRERLLQGEPVSEPEAALAADGVGLWYEYLKNKEALYDQKLECGWHRGGLEQKERISAVNRFSTCQELKGEFDDAPPEPPIDIMVSTNTLELGIDIGDVTTVVNIGAPYSTNEYAQRVGRGGRKRESAALTIVNRKNPLDLYFWRHFAEYADPDRREFEDAPIIITNNSIVETHILARILDFAAGVIGGDNREIAVSDFRRELTLKDGPVTVNFIDKPERFGRLLYRRLFKERFIKRGEITETAIDNYIKWLEKERDILSVEPNVISPNAIETMIVNKCIELAGKMDLRRPVYKDEDKLAGMGAKDRSLVPRMRGAGQTVGIYLIRERSEELKDTISRRQAVSLRPPGGYATQGHNAFKIERMEDDGQKATEIRNLLMSDSGAEDYFKKHLLGFTGAVDVNYRIPKDLLVRYSPYRFYCPKSGCWRTYTSLPPDGKCDDCGTELRQITEVYYCPQCGEIFEPPVPRSCINPQCIEKRPDFIRALNQKKTPEWSNYFKLQSYPDLHWRCSSCGMIINFHNKHSLQLPPNLKNMSFRDSNFETPERVSKHFQYRPEGRQKKIQTIQEQGVNIAHFSCNRCKERSGKAYGKINVTTVPTSKTILLDYFVDDGILCEPIPKNQLAEINFKRVKVVSLAKEQYRTYRDSKKNMAAVVNAIFPEERVYLANLYGTHAVFFRFTNLIDEFLYKDPLGCKDVADCTECLRGTELIEGWKDIAPRTELLPWETIKQKEGLRAKRPDPRGRWCEKARDNDCTDIVPCGSNGRCFRKEGFLKYVIIHTIKHALLLAMPRYTGVDTNLMKGVLHPNGRLAPELAIIDQVEDGSGGLFLLRRNWKKIWDMTTEILELTSHNEGNLLLPYGCSRYNADLCPFIAHEFTEMVKKHD